MGCRVSSPAAARNQYSRITPDLTIKDRDLSFSGYLSDIGSNPALWQASQQRTAWRQHQPLKPTVIIKNRTISQPSSLENAYATQANLVARGVRMAFQSGKEPVPILKGIDLEVPRGTVQLLMGPSGSGKTTLLTILAGLLTPTGGQVYLLDRDITRLSRPKLAAFRRQHIGFIFQHFNLFPALTALENIELVLGIKGITGTKARREARHLLEQVELGGYGDRRPRDLSGGQKQRVAIARSLAGNPEIIMADEPTAALDSQSGHTVTTLLRRLAKEQGCTVLIVTHDPRIHDIADRITYLEDGSLVRNTSFS